jgi:hypothetical protein
MPIVLAGVTNDTVPAPPAVRLFEPVAVTALTNVGSLTPVRSVVTGQVTGAQGPFAPLMSWVLIPVIWAAPVVQPWAAMTV